MQFSRKPGFCQGGIADHSTSFRKNLVGKTPGFGNLITWPTRFLQKDKVRLFLAFGWDSQYQTSKVWRTFEVFSKKLEN